MDFHFNLFSILLLFSGMTALLISLILFQRLQIRSILWFALMMLGSSLWAIFYSLELSSSSLDEMLFWINYEYIGISSIPALWILFVVHYIGKKEWLNGRSLVAIFFFPVVVLILVWTNRWHHIHYSSTIVDASGPFPLLSIVPGPWYHIHTAYFYFMLALGMMLLFRYYSQSEPIYRKQTRTILIGGIIPWITNFAYLTGFRPFGHLDLTPYTFVFSSLIIAYGLTRYQLFKVIPFAREKLVDSIREGMVVLDSRQRIIDVNATFRNFFKDEANKIMGERINELMPTQYKMHQLIQRQTDGTVEIELDSAEEKRHFEVSITVVRDKNEVQGGSLLIFWDITNLKKASERLHKQTEQLQELNELKSRLFSIIAHDLRSPLASLVSILNLAQSKRLTAAEINHLFPMLSKNVDTTSALLENLLQWAQSQQKGERIHYEQFNFRALVDEKIGFFEKRAAEKEVQLVNEVDENATLWADINMIRMILRNLISNALKFCDRGDSITIRVSRDGDFTTAQVIDTGTGMEESVIAQLFSFKRFSQTGTRNEKGTGLGLTLCKDFIEKNKGTIWVESQPGKGSTFSFRVRNQP
jgi:PAS domain S-box-containing protein